MRIRAFSYSMRTVCACACPRAEGRYLALFTTLDTADVFRAAWVHGAAFAADPNAHVARVRYRALAGAWCLSGSARVHMRGAGLFP
jgi:hypothetical protein